MPKSHIIKRIDQTLLANSTNSWRKVALIVAISMDAKNLKTKPIDDHFFASRIAHLVRAGALELQGDLTDMRASEIRKSCANQLLKPCA